MAERTIQELHTLQALPLEAKILKTKARIREWVNHYGTDGVYVSFSGGKDSTVLLHLVRELYPNIDAVFVDTGLEYPEIRDHVKTFDNVTWLKPKMNFKQVIEKYGYPFISKEVSGKIHELRTWLDRQDLTWDALTNERTNERTNGKCAYAIADFLGIPRRGSDKNNPDYLMLKEGMYPSRLPCRVIRAQGKCVDKNGKKSSYNMEKWAFLLDAPYRISNKCCNVIKKQPIHEYEKVTGKKPFIGMLADESRMRTQGWLRTGCNAFEGNRQQSNPMAFWTDQDVLLYIKLNDIKLASVYGEVVTEDNEQLSGQETWGSLGIFDTGLPFLKTTGCQRTGCMFCAYGAHLGDDDRFVSMKSTHPTQYEWIMKPWSEGGLGYKEVIDWINDNGNLNIKY